MTPLELRETDRLLLRCGARASALLHPNREPGCVPSAAETEASRARLRADLVDLQTHLNRILADGHDVHASR